jgi:glycosyltransferase involved in cell wall biosynthesis
VKILHIYPTDICSQNRLFKEACYILSSGIAESVYAVGLWVDGREEIELHSSGLKIIRIRTKIRELFAKRYHFKYTLLRKLLALYALIQYFYRCYIAIKKIEPQVLTCHYVTDLPIVCIFGWIRGCPIVYLPHELETERSGLSGFSKYRDKIFEHFFIRYVRDVVVVCEPIAQWYKDRYEIDNIHVVRNAPTKNAAKLKGTPADFRTKFLIPKESIVFIYQGVFGQGRGTRELIEAFTQLENGIAHLVMMGFGSDASENMVKDAARRSNNIHFHEAVPLDLITSYSAGADLGIFISEGNSLSYEMSLPNKFFEYIHAGLPVVVSRNLKYLASIIEGNSIGFSIELDELASELMNISPAEAASCKDNVRRFASSAYWEVDAVAYIQVYRDI